MKTVIRSLSTAEAAPIFSWLHSYSFRPTPPVADEKEFLERFSHTEGYTKLFVLYEDENPVATAAAGPMIQNVRGQLMDMAGVHDVMTHPSYRRKGYSFKLLKHLLTTLHEIGNGFSCLYPFRESFYERQGYANLPGMIKAEIDIQALQPLMKNTYQTQLELVEFIQQPERYYEFLNLYQEQTHGMALFKKKRPPDPAYHKAWLLFSKKDGRLDGLMVYNLQGSVPTELKFNINRFYPLSMDSHYHFLNWIAYHIDQTSEISIVLPSSSQPQTWFSDLRYKLGEYWISPMGRVLDIEKLNGLNVGEGSFSAQISDPTCPWNEGSWQFEGHSGKLAVTKIKQAEQRLTIQGLSALVYGNIPPSSFKFRGWGDIPADMGKNMLNLFPPAIPYLHEFF